ncbi:MAG: hypothetical protein KF803_10700 [Cyclobacteriaceae bacterium]|nr:hypothetical protein [Cyclobacteriaceae bacterium]
MKEFQPRTFKFKAWNREARLLMKLGSIDCVKGELFKRDHILLQYTGLVDKHEEEIYEMDILLKKDQKFLVRWHDSFNGWYIVNYPGKDSFVPLHKEDAQVMKRLCNFFESEENAETR